MPYIVRSTESKRGKASDYETKALLYLMGGRDDSCEIFSFAIDFFNDVTGLSVHANKVWDLQSKGNAAKGPKDIGKELVTLFKNYMSDLDFDFLILFMAGVPDSFRIDNNLNTFGVENIAERALEKVKKGLEEEATKKTYIEDEWINADNITSFLNKVIFVIDDKSKAEYVKSIISLNSRFVPSDEILDGVFNKIRDAQSAKKNTKSVEGETISHFRDVIHYDRTIKAQEIRLMVINTLVNRNIVGYGTPQFFFPLIQNYDVIEQRKVIEDCQLQISLALFDKANSDSFWDLLSVIVEAVKVHKELGTSEIFSLIADTNAVKSTLMDVLSIQYLISVMKEALE